MDSLQIAIIGAGPSGIFTAEALTDQSVIPVRVDVIDRLPTPFGLVRYGVAPDHVAIRAVRESLETVLSRPQARFIGNLTIGKDVSIEFLRKQYDTVIYAYGSPAGRCLDIPGESLPGNVSAPDLVAWYCGHPDASPHVIGGLIASSKQVAVIGAGNVAVDVVRVLSKSHAELTHTDMPQHVLEALQSSAVTDIHLVARRAPAHASFTTKELRELGELADADVLVRPEDLVLDAVGRAAIAKNRAAGRNLDVLTAWAARPSAAKRRRIHLRFNQRPTAIMGTDRVNGLVVERTSIDNEGRAIGTLETEQLTVQLLVRAVGYRGAVLPGVPFDENRNVIPTTDCRVLREGKISIGEYAVGWIKRGPSGVIGTNKLDAAETASAVLTDAAVLLNARSCATARSGLDALLDEQHLETVGMNHWKIIDSEERALGSRYGRARTTVHERSALLALCRSEAGLTRK